jgi:hypothetical protein
MMPSVRIASPIMIPAVRVISPAGIEARIKSGIKPKNNLG